VWLPLKIQSGKSYSQIRGYTLQRITSISTSHTAPPSAPARSRRGLFQWHGRLAPFEIQPVASMLCQLEELPQFRGGLQTAVAKTFSVLFRGGEAGTCRRSRFFPPAAFSWSKGDGGSRRNRSCDLSAAMIQAILELVGCSRVGPHTRMSQGTILG
jgi:hypothetical protein